MSDPAVSPDRAPKPPPTSRAARLAAESVLPARSMADIRLARHVAGPGCPLCAVRDDAVARGMDGLLTESVNDPGVRGQLDRARGYCRTHIGELLRRDRSGSGGTASVAILFGAILRVRLAELDGLSGVQPRGLGRGPGRGVERRLEAAARPPDCHFCRRAAEAEAIAAVSLVRLLADPEWAAALARAEFCLDDLLVIWTTMARAGRPALAAFEPVATAQLARLGDLATAVEAFAHNSAYDRRHLETDEQRQASGRAAAVLGGKDPTA